MKYREDSSPPVFMIIKESGTELAVRPRNRYLFSLYPASWFLMKTSPGRSTNQPSEHAQMNMNLQETELAYYSSILGVLSETHHQSTAG